MPVVITVWADSGFQTRISGKAITCGLSANHSLGPEKTVPGDTEWKVWVFYSLKTAGLCDLSPAHFRVWLGTAGWVRVTWQLVRAPGTKCPVTARVSELRIGSTSTVCFLYRVLSVWLRGESLKVGVQTPIMHCSFG